MTWILQADTDSRFSTDGRYEIRPVDGCPGYCTLLHAAGPDRPLLVGSADDCRGLAEAMADPEAAPDGRPADASLGGLAARARRSAERLQELDGRAAPPEMIRLEAATLRRWAAKLAYAADALTTPRSPT